MTKKKTLTPLTFAINAEEQNKEEYSGKTEELIKRKDVENAPFTIITTGGVSFATFGRYKITEDYETEAQAEKAVKEMTWNRLIQVMTLVHTMLNEKM